MLSVLTQSTVQPTVIIRSRVVGTIERLSEAAAYAGTRYLLPEGTRRYKIFTQVATMEISKLAGKQNSGLCSRQSRYAIHCVEIRPVG